VGEEIAGLAVAADGTAVAAGRIRTHRRAVDLARQAVRPRRDARRRGDVGRLRPRRLGAP
jgi:hypothetical protein